MDQSSENIGFTSTHSSIGVQKKNSKLWIIIALLVVLLVGGYFIYSNLRNNEPPKEAVLPTEAPTTTPTEEATPSGTITPTKAAAGEVKSAEDLNIQVLNGSGKEGVAVEVKGFLAGKGYKNLSTGNADNFDYEKVNIRIKDSRKKFLSALQKDLEEKYEIGTGSGTLDADNEFDAAVIVGK